MRFWYGYLAKEAGDLVHIDRWLRFPSCDPFRFLRFSTFMASSDLGKTTDRGTSKETTPSDPSSSLRHRFRADLEIVGAGETEIIDAEVIVRDARSGQQHVFTADEIRLCRAADGTKTLRAIRQEFRAETGRDLPFGELFAFFRRLRNLGLLEESAANQSATVTADDARQLTESQFRKRAARERQDDAFARSTSMAPKATDEGLAAAAPQSDTHGAPFDGNGRRARRERLILSQWPAKASSRRAAVKDLAIPPTEIKKSTLAAKTNEAGKRENLADLGAGASRAVRAAWARAAYQESVEDATRSSDPARLSLFNPNFVLGVLAVAARRLKYSFALFPLAILAAIWIACQGHEMLARNISAIDASVIPTIILGFVIANFTSRVIQGAFIRGFGGEVKQFGIALTLVIPRFFVDLRGIAALRWRGQLWVHAAPLIARLALFAAGMLLWFGLQRSAPALSQSALIVSLIGLMTFMFSAWPLLPSDGHRWMATFFSKPNLRADAGRSLASLFARTEQAPELSANDSSAVNFCLLAIAIVVAVLALLAQAIWDVATSGQIGLVSSVFLALVGIALTGWAIALWRYGNSREIEALDPGASRQSGGSGGAQADFADEQKVTVGTVARVIWAVILSGLVAVAFLPYRYQAGGRFEILPTQRAVVTARTSGEIEKIMVREGDWVVADQVVAELSSKDQQREVAIANAELQHAKAQLAQFGGSKQPNDQMNGPSDLDRSSANKLNDEPDVAEEKNDAAAANYTRARAEHAARTEVERLTRKLANARDQLADTNVRSPSAGRVVTPNVHLLIGAFLRRGAEMLTLEDTRVLAAEIDLPEADVGLIKVGDNVRLRPLAEQDREIVGHVTEIAPAAQVKPYGTIVRVEASIPNSGDNLRPAMTGYAKVDTQDMRVWEAFLRRIIRIVRVEMWSWIP